ncbi:DUF2236 domain-containing protein, partial [Acinetobacter baumannii]|nr:DUF2236 domain-containing protein [Acinetobacter baumannii]
MDFRNCSHEGQISFRPVISTKPISRCTISPKDHRIIFEKILFQGRDEFSKPIPTELENFFNYIEQKPDWL